MINSNKLKLSADYMLNKEDGDSPEFFLFNIKGGEVFQINSTSYDFLSLCDGEKTLGDIYVDLTQMYSTDQEILRSDFEKLLEQWEQQGIII